VDLRFRLEKLEAPNDENKLLVMMVSAPAELELPSVHSAMVPVEWTLHWLSIWAERSEVMVEE